MKILTMHLKGAKRNILFGDKKLETLHRLMDMGCFGELSGDTSEWNVLARHDSETLTLFEYLTQAGRECAMFDDFGSLHKKLDSGAWEYCHVTASFSSEADPAAPYIDFDRRLGETLHYLSDDTLIAIIGEACFVIVSANNPISGYHEGAALDITPTLLDLAGYPLPSTLAGKSWVAGMELKRSSGLSEDEQALLRERLSGLGYI